MGESESKEQEKSEDRSMFQDITRNHDDQMIELSLEDYRLERSFYS